MPSIDARFYPGVGHRPSWVNHDAAEWLNAHLHFPSWRNISIESLGETRIGDWAATTGAHINDGYATEKTEAGVRAVGRNFPGPAPVQLQAVRSMIGQHTKISTHGKVGQNEPWPRKAYPLRYQSLLLLAMQMHQPLQKEHASLASSRTKLPL